MSQTAVMKLKKEMVWFQEWMEDTKRCPNLPIKWKDNVPKFLKNMAAEVPEITTWKWLRRAVERYEVKKPFGFIQAVLRNPWGSFPEDRIANAQAQERERKGRAYRSSLYSSEKESAGPPGSYPSPVKSCICKSDCGGANALCHVAEAKISGCRVGERCMPCGLAAIPA